MAPLRLALRPKAGLLKSGVPQTCRPSQLGRTISSTSIKQAEIVETNTQDPLADLEQTSHSNPLPPQDVVSAFDPMGRFKLYGKPLPPSRYRYKFPKYKRGPLHPHKAPPASHLMSREFTPGPFCLPRMQQFYENTVASDLMILSYRHVPPGTPKTIIGQRLRSWDDSSPYYKNRGLRPPRGLGGLQLSRKPINFRNIPKLESIIVSIWLKEGTKDSATTHVAGMIAQAMTGVRANIRYARKTLTAGQGFKFPQRMGRPVAVVCEMKGELMWHFFSTLTSIVLPRVKDWTGMKRWSGDMNGNMGMTLSADTVGTWPEIAVNYDSYPAALIPPVMLNFKTTARDDRDSRLLLSGLGMPFKAMRLPPKKKKVFRRPVLLNTGPAAKK